MASPSFRHQVVLLDILQPLLEFFRNHSCRVLTSPFDVRPKGYAEKFSEDPNVVQPDLVVICDEENVTDELFDVLNRLKAYCSKSTNLTTAPSF